MKFWFIMFGALLPVAAQAQPVNPCADPAGFARQLVAANPGVGYDVLAVALLKAQEMYGCRAPAPIAATPAYPRETRCSWQGFGITREWVCEAD